MKKRTVSNAPVGIAGVHYVAAELSRRGLIALPTIRNTAGYDIIVATPDGTKHANVQVKTSLNRVNFWPMPSSAKICAKPNDYYVLVRWLSKENKFDAFMLKGREAKTLVEANEVIVREKTHWKWDRPVDSCRQEVGKGRRALEAQLGDLDTLASPIARYPRANRPLYHYLIEPQTWHAVSFSRGVGANYVAWESAAVSAYGAGCHPRVWILVPGLNSPAVSQPFDIPGAQRRD